MISPDTAPGTEVICIDDSSGPYGNGSLCKGSIYTVELIARTITGGYAVVLLELKPWTTFMPPWGPVDVGFELRRFRYLDIPRELNELLVTAQPRFLEVEPLGRGLSLRGAAACLASLIMTGRAPRAAFRGA
jgi:hypothetical protein